VPLNVQKEVCLRHLRIARDLRRPVTLHCVHAYGSLLELLERFRADECGTSTTPFPTCVLHGFRGPSDLVVRFERIGCYFSFSGSPLDAAHLQLVQQIGSPRGVETDSPDQCPGVCVLGAGSEASTRPANEPANLDAIIRYIAAEMAWDPFEFGLLVTANARAVFAID
jgi:TatD DNase family protein